MLQRVGTWLSLTIVLAILGVIALSYAMNEGADDIRQEVRVMSGLGREHPRRPLGPILAWSMTTDLSATDYDARHLRADLLDHRADRMRELAAAAALGGVVLMLATARPQTRQSSERVAINPLARTRSNGTV